MSRAFVKEDDPTGGAAVLPDRAISPHPNLVTRRGLRLIEAQDRRVRASAGGGSRRRDARAALPGSCATGPRGSARLGSRSPRRATQSVRFGTTVTGMREDGREVTFAIVGEDEAEPEAGRIAWTAPVARALLGGEPGEVRRLPKGELEIVAIRPSTE